MHSSIDKKTLEHLAKLARIELDPNEEEKLLKDFASIIGNFEELKALDTSNTEPMTGGTSLRNAFREDEERENTDQGKGADAFPRPEKGFLKVPPVFGE